MRNHNRPSSMKTDYKFSHWFQVQSFTDASDHLEQTAYLLQQKYKETAAFHPIAAIIEMLYTSTWCLNRPMMRTLDAMARDFSNEIIPNLRKEKAILKMGVQVISEKLDMYKRAHQERESTEITNRLRCEKCHSYSIMSYFTRKSFDGAANKRVRAEQQLCLAKMTSSEILDELLVTEMLIIDLNSLVKIMHNLYNKGVEAGLTSD